jgi:hypothetical protein
MSKTITLFAVLVGAFLSTRSAEAFNHAVQIVDADVISEISVDALRSSSPVWKSRGSMNVASGPRLWLFANVPYMVYEKAIVRGPVDDPIVSVALDPGTVLVRLLRNLTLASQAERPTPARGREYKTEIMQIIDHGVALLQGAVGWMVHVEYTVVPATV